MTDRHNVCACALLGMLLSVGPLSGMHSWLQARVEARTTAVVEQAAVERSVPTPSPDVPELIDSRQADTGQSAATAVVSPPASEARSDNAPQSEGDATTEEQPNDDGGSAPSNVPAEADATTAAATPSPTQPAESLLDHNQMIVFYGSPISSKLGILGAFEPEDAANRVRDQASVYDNLNGDDRGAFGAFDLIYSQVQDQPTENGLYLRYLDDSVVQRYLDVARERDLQLILDLQIGRGTLVDEARKAERFLRDPRVHLAIDPEYAVGPQGIPIETPGTITADDLNKLQDYLSELMARYKLPPKMVVIHQYLEGTVLDGAGTKSVPNIDLVLNMDAFGDAKQKREKYQMFSARPYAQRRSFNIFLQQDDNVLSEAEALRLTPSPDVIFYQ